MNVLRSSRHLYFGRADARNEAIEAHRRDVREAILETTAATVAHW